MGKDKKEKVLIYSEYKYVVLISRLIAIPVVVVFGLLFGLSTNLLVVNVLILVLGLIYHVFILKKFIKVSETIALLLNSSTYLVVAVVMIYYTGGLESPLYLLLFFAPMGVAMSYGPKSAGYTVFLELFILVLLSFGEPDLSIFKMSVLRIIGYVVPLLMTAPFASVTATRYLDIKKEKEKQQELSKELKNHMRLIKEAQQKERDMIDIMGHELRTPMSIIKNYFFLLQKWLDKKMINGTKSELEKVHKYTEGIEENIDREVKLINILLSATKLEDQKLELSKEVVDVIDVIEDGIVAQKDEIRTKGLYLNFNKPENWEEYPRVYADRVRIQEVMDNLLSNAVKYTVKGGIDVTIEHDLEFVTVSVKDTGVGIEKENIGNLGKKFYRVGQYVNSDSGQSSIVRPGGSGLGLYVTYGVVKAHGGNIRVESEAGKGSTFHFTIPIYHGQEVEVKECAKNVFKRMNLEKDNG